MEKSSLMKSSSYSGLRGELALGRQELIAKFRSSPPRILGSGELLAPTVGLPNAIWHLRSGWACQFHSLRDGHRAIVDVYLPGDVIGLDAEMGTRSPAHVLTLTSVTTETIPAEGALIDLMASPHTALYIAWLLGQRQQRVDRLLAALSCLDARERLATIFLDFYTRLRRRQLITAPAYNLPLTQEQIGSYVGLTVVHVNRMLRSLSDDRIVQMQRHYVTILDVERLKKLAQRAVASSSSADTEERVSIEAAE
jgi:CRP/FNR family transcriptional regulator, anaerobic regulatory protein